MPSHIYNCLNNISWNCVTCGMPQFTSSFFDSLDIHTQNSFSSIASDDSIGPPDSCSSPKAAHQRGKQKATQSWNKFTILNLNFQSIKNKKAETLNIIDSYNPDIIIGTETWLNDSVHNSEIFPPNYNIYRRDWRDGFGGVLVAVKADIITDHLDVEYDTYIIFRRLVDTYLYYCQMFSWYIITYMILIRCLVNTYLYYCQMFSWYILILLSDV